MTRRARGAYAAWAALALLSAACGRRPETKTGDSATADSLGTPPPASVAVSPPADTTAPASAAAVDTARRTEKAATPTPAPTPAPSQDVMVGEVVAGGVAESPVTSLRVQGRGPMTLVGPLEPELRRLGGATVSVAGGLSSAAPDAFTVARYEIVSVDGARPAVGTLLSRNGALWLAGTDTSRLASVPSALQTKPGAKVWIVGRRTGTELTVQSYGILRDP